ncbi:hypothetical protein FDP41_005167 [Naegleria fowleri]|uniref:Ribosomal protein mS38 C-terminal domain-containing protein n=1 Tax=Naegleria fowleri TaxID=5763 RepID=A0A6A5BPI6_NAEFO|nr:uncharacterized protein FDP41_005167 [Naegleria fowleri]KAF0975840.1 hypothetical protein FDP41_005167 [Naegleria fowleri]CAG4708925.1 unnamed protein product [Naegleria fowleri]
MNRLCARFTSLPAVRSVVSLARQPSYFGICNNFSLGIMKPSIPVKNNVIKPVERPNKIVVLNFSESSNLVSGVIPKNKPMRPIIIDTFKMDSVKRKRHRKMKKHKYRKRLKKTRSLRKRLGKR